MLSPATMLITDAMMTAPYRYDRRACRSTLARIAGSVTLVSETWNVIPTVKARYAKSA